MGMREADRNGLEARALRLVIWLIAPVARAFGHMPVLSLGRLTDRWSARPRIVFVPWPKP